MSGLHPTFVCVVRVANEEGGVLEPLELLQEGGSPGTKVGLLDPALPGTLRAVLCSRSIHSLTLRDSATSTLAALPFPSLADTICACYSVAADHAEDAVPVLFPVTPGDCLHGI